ncbi:hypothetical protein EON83_25590 [bacterium]|nr:MAG: hypothetical protein EON83_25590 [bacterium]
MNPFLLAGPEPYPVEELSGAARERRLLDKTWSADEELEAFHEFLLQHQASHQAWQLRFELSQMLKVQGAERTPKFNRICGQLFLLEEEAKLVAYLQPWVYELIDAPDWAHPATREVWRRFQLTRDRDWPGRKRFAAMHGDLREGDNAIF